MGTMVFEFDEEIRGNAKIKVVGVGGAGCNAIDSMIKSGLKGVEFIAVNTDAQALEHSKADIRLQIGRETTRGLGAGANPEVGRRAMEESKEQLMSILSDADMVFIAAGMGGGTGTGAAGVAANIAHDIGALTVSVVTKPFKFEGKKRMMNAERGIEDLKEYVDTLIVIQNQRLIDSVTQNTTLINAFQEVDEVLRKAVKGITDLIVKPGFINLDFSDVKTIMQGKGDAMMGIGEAEGEHRCVEAAQSAIQSTLLENYDIKGAQGILVNICGGEDLTLFEINDAMDVIYSAAGVEDSNIIFGTAIDKDLGDRVRVTVVATGFEIPENNSKVNHGYFTDIRKNKMSIQMEPVMEKVKDSVEINVPRAQYSGEIDYEIPTFLRNNRD